MRHPGRTRAIGAAVVAAALVGGLALIVSAGSGGRRRAPLVLSAAPSPSAGAPTGDSGAAPGFTAPGSVGGTSPGGPAPTHAGSAPAATTAPAHQPAPTATAPPTAAGHPTAAAPVAPTAAAPADATPGTYRYRQTNPATPPSEGTLVVAASSPGTQTWTRNFGTNVPVSTSVMSYRPGGIFTVAQSEQLNGSTLSCSFAAPVPSPPLPATVGRTFSGQATCTGQATLSVTGRIESNALLTLDGAPVNTAVVHSNLVLAVIYLGTPFEAKLTQFDWYAPNVRMPVQTRIQVVVPALSITSDSTYLLESSKPS